MIRVDGDLLNEGEVYETRDRALGAVREAWGATSGSILANPNERLAVARTAAVPLDRPEHFVVFCLFPICIRLLKGSLRPLAGLLLGTLGIGFRPGVKQG